MTDDSRLASAEVEQKIMAFMREELLTPEVTFERDEDLLAGGILDSIAVLRLAAYVEQEFQIKIAPADYVIENFQSVALLTEYVQRAAGRDAGSPSDSER